MGIVNGVVTAGSSIFTMVMPFVHQAMLDKVGVSEWREIMTQPP